MPILLARHEVLAIAPSIEEAVGVAPGQSLALGRFGRLPQAVLVALDRQARNDNRTPTTIAEPEAELHVRHPVEAELRVEAVDGPCVLAPKRHAVALDRVHIR